ncbi:VOC family protein [Balneola vulgaris]|jgi:predicted enzyme related to lactoylglutathione lyase|uniref:VOC family protein n=1 Tax=Balneola vulgaris TaxID=287535 RepID=UPI000370E5CA|nr:VOC family protein [Balneola vulgaris]
MKNRVKGIGGVFLKADDPKATSEWYKKHLGIKSGQWGGTFQWKKSNNPSQNGYTAWSIFKSDTEYTNPSTKDAMINYRVEDLESLLKTLKEEGVEVIGEMESFEYGKFGWIMDPNGYKIELWEPNDEEYEKLSTDDALNQMN